MINYNAGFLSEEFRAAPRSAEFRAQEAAIAKRCGKDEACDIKATEQLSQDAMRKGQLPMVSWDKIVEHIDHVAKIAGVDHVGLGSDFDGATMPIGMEDVSKLPKITEALLKRGYSEADIEKILGGNILRVMEQVEKLKTEK
jgi:membrane dipeptidase